MFNMNTLWHWYRALDHWHIVPSIHNSIFGPDAQRLANMLPFRYKTLQCGNAYFATMKQLAHVIMSYCSKHTQWITQPRSMNITQMTPFGRTDEYWNEYFVTLKELVYIITVISLYIDVTKSFFRLFSPLCMLIWLVFSLSVSFACCWHSCASVNIMHSCNTCR